MSKKKNKATVISQGTKVQTESKPTSKTIVATPAAKPTGNKIFWIVSAIIFALAFALNMNTFDNTFVLDDHGIIKSNKITKNGISADNIKRIFTTSHRAGDVSDLEHSLYRPLTKTVFAWAWTQGGGKPEIFHKINVWFYAIACMLMFAVLYHAFKRNWLLAFLATLLYTVHPLHSEVVANNKSLDEIMSVMGMFLVFRSIQLHAKTKNIVWLALMLLALFIALFSKENLIVIVALVPLFVHYFIDSEKIFSEKLPIDMKQMMLYTGISLSMAIVFLLARHNALSQYHLPYREVSAMDNVLAMADGRFNKLVTAIALLGKYLMFLFLPLSLSCDYSYKTVLPHTLGSWEFWLAFLIYAGLAYFAVKTFFKKNIIGFGILFFFISVSIVSNIFIIIGVSFGDRLMFLPSVGWAIAVAGFLYWLFNKGFELDFHKTVGAVLQKNALAVVLIGLACVFYSFKTRERNVEWKTDYTLISGDVEKYPESVHLLFYWGNHLTSSEYAEGRSEQEVLQANESAKMVFRKALANFPALPSDGYNQFGKAFYKTKNLDSAEYYYLRAYHEDSTNSVFLNNIGTIKFEKALPQLNTPMGKVLLDSAEFFFTKANQRDTTMADYMNNLGAINGQTGRFEQAIKWFSKAYQVDTTTEAAILACRSIAMTYGMIGDSVNKRLYDQKAAAVMEYRRGVVARRNAENNIN